MVIPTREYPSDTSVSSELDELSYIEKRVQIFAKQMLQGRIFKGAFQEKRYVDSISSYRDVVSLANDEQELIQVTLAVKQRFDELYADHWIGITTPDEFGTPAAYSFWVELPEDITLGTYWFRIKRIKFSKHETCLRIKVLRPISYDTDIPSVEGNQTKIDTNTVLPQIKHEIKEKLLYLFQDLATFTNFKNSIVFLFMLLTTVVIALIEILKYFSEFFLKFMKESSNFMKSIAPIFQALANLVDRLFRTLCMLIAYLCRGPGLQTQPTHVQPQYIHNQNLRALPSPSRRHGVIIEEIQ